MNPNELMNAGPVKIEGLCGPPDKAKAEAEPYILPADYLPQLEALPELPEGWVLPWYFDDVLMAPEENRDTLIQLARVFGSVGVNYWHTDEDLLRAKSIADEAGVGATVTIMPWHINGCKPDPDNWDTTIDELADIRTFLRYIKASPWELNVTAFLLDSECYQEPDPRVTTRLNMVFDLVGSEFPGVHREWFADGHRPEMWDARFDARSVACYASYAASQFEGWFLANRAKDLNAPWSMWISGDSGYVRGSWELVLNRSPREHWMIGRMLRMMKDVGLLERVIWYPGPRAGSPTWMLAFVATVRGMAGMELEE